MEEQWNTTQPSSLLPPSQRGTDDLPVLDTSLIYFHLIFGAVIASIYACIAVRKQHSSRLQSHRKVLCPRCHYFSGIPYLKCSLHPVTVMTEQAVGCEDYVPNSTVKRVKKWRKALWMVVRQKRNGDH